MQSRNVSFDQAKELVEQHDRWRKLYLRNYHDADWDDLLLYHLTINTGRMSAGEATDLIVNLLSKRG